MRNISAWAEAEFGHAELGDVRRTSRLVRMAAEVASHPAGTVTKACESSASREGAFRLLENPSISPEGVSRAAALAAVRRCAKESFVYVAVDGTSLTLVDKLRNKGFGAVGTWSQGASGVHVMSAFAVSPAGVPLGVCNQDMWTRTVRTHVPAKARSSQNSEERETRYWLSALEETQRSFAASAPDCRPWFQLDRGGDCWPVLAMAYEQKLQLTVRAAHDRRLDGRTDLLWTALEKAPILGYQDIEISARPSRKRQWRQGGRRFCRWTPPRKARTAKLVVRALRVPITLGISSKKRLRVEVNAVLVRERGRAQDRIEWLLLTTHPVHTRADALAVVKGYGYRWRVEDLHRTWKRGLCRVEESQLRTRNALFKWATILCTVATRALHLTHLARTQPELSALDEFSKHELEAIIALRQPKGIAPDAVPTVGQAVRWLADMGGYMGSKKHPPGPTVVGRGLLYVTAAARALAFRAQKR